MQSQVMLERPGLLTNPNPPWVRIVAHLNPGVSVKKAQAAVQVAYQRVLLEMAGSTPTPCELQEIAQERLDLRPAARGFSPQRQFFARPLVISVRRGWTGSINRVRQRCKPATGTIGFAAEGDGGAPGARRRPCARLAAIAGGERASGDSSRCGRIVVSRLGHQCSAKDGCLWSWQCSHRLSRCAPDARMLLFTAALCALMVVLFGLAPAFQRPGCLSCRL